MKNQSFITIMISTLCIISTNYAQENDDYQLPNGELVINWTDQTQYSKTYHVSQNHPNASDDNPGTYEKPFKTINKAASIVKAGEKVVVCSGIYREKIEPAFGGLSEDKMISYEVAPGNKVIVKGSLVFEEDWAHSLNSAGQDWAHNLWQAPLDASLFAPFYIENASADDIEVMPWASRWRGKIPYTLGRGLVFQDGKRLQQLATYEDISWVTGSYWIDKKRERIHVHPFDNIEPSTHTFEFTHLQQLFVPTKVGLGYIRVSGFIFEQAGNGFPRVGVGAVYVNGGHHWIIENNTVRHCGSVAIEIGARILEYQVSSRAEGQRVKAHVGGHIVSHNHISACGTGGIQGHTVSNAVLAYNHIHHIGWQHVERYWECAAIKVLINTNVVAAKNCIHHIEEASAIWFDWDNDNCRITQNAIYHIDRIQNGAVFIEASKARNMIDNNFLWEVRGPGISLGDTDNALVCHNTIAYTHTPVLAKRITTRSVGGKPVSSRHNTIQNNILYRNQGPLVVEDPQNICDYNLFVGPNLEVWQRKTRFDKNSRQMEFQLEWCPQTKELTLNTSMSLPQFPLIEQCTYDFWGNKRSPEQVTPGIWEHRTKNNYVFKLNH